jgi:glycine/D-amino acid oxidase-like deaminating enzyme
MSVVVVGAGITGSCVTYFLARQGIPVTLIDEAPAPACGVTGGSFAWIGDSGRDWPGGADDLRQYVRADYRTLETELHDVHLRWTGSLRWDDGNGDEAILDNGRRWVNRDEVLQLEPGLVRPPDRALYTPTDGAVDPVALTQALVHGARAYGARTVLDTSVTALRITGDRVDGVITTAGEYRASTVVLAAGTAIPALCQPLGVTIPVPPSPALLIRATAPPRTVRTILSGPRLEVREVRPGDLLMTAPEGEDMPEPDLQRYVQETFDELRSLYRNSDSFALVGHRLSPRPMPPDGPIVGPITPDRSVYVTVSHSAICLAPTIGRLAATELATGAALPQLDRCRPNGASVMP